MMDPIARTIANLIRMRGGQFTMLDSQPGEYDPATGTVERVAKLLTVKAVVFEARQSTMPNSLIQAGDKQVFVQADPLVQAPDALTTEFIYKGKPHRIVWMKELNPSGTKPLMYELFVRA